MKCVARLNCLLSEAVKWPRLQMIWNLFVPIIAFAIMALIGLFYLNYYVSNVSVPHVQKLFDCTNGIANIRLKVPKGHGYYLELNNPEFSPAQKGFAGSSYVFNGHISISNAISLLIDFPIGSDKSWFSGSSIVLTGFGVLNTNAPMLVKLLQPDKTYDIQITFEPPPPASSSIWLYWLQSQRDVNN